MKGCSIIYRCSVNAILHIPQQEKSRGAISGARGARRLVHHGQAICQEMFHQECAHIVGPMWVHSREILLFVWSHTAETRQGRHPMWWPFRKRKRDLYHTFNFGLSQMYSFVACGVSVACFWTLCWLTYPDMRKVALSENNTCYVIFIIMDCIQHEWSILIMYLLIIWFVCIQT